MAIIAILAALLLPALSAAKGRAHRTTCLNNQRQLGVGWELYASEADDQLALNLEATLTEPTAVRRDAG